LDIFAPPAPEEYAVDGGNDEVDGKDVVDVSNDDAEGGNEDIEPTIGYLIAGWAVPKAMVEPLTPALSSAVTVLVPQCTGVITNLYSHSYFP